MVHLRECSTRLLCVWDECGRWLGGYQCAVWHGPQQHYLSANQSAPSRRMPTSLCGASDSLSWSYMWLRFGRYFFFFFSSPPTLTPLKCSYCFLLYVLVPYGCTHSPFWWLYCSWWLIPRIPILGGCALTTISITSESVVVLQTCIRFYLATITVSFVNSSFPASVSLGCQSFIEPSNLLNY